MEPQRDDAGVFVSRPLPSSRAWLALIFLGTTLLSIGGTIEYLTGSPMIEGQGVGRYFATVFGFHAAAFGGSALIGALPALAVRSVKIGWLFVVVALYIGAFFTWLDHPNAGSAADWLRLSIHYVPALLPIAAGCLWGNNAVLEEVEETQ